MTTETDFAMQLLVRMTREAFGDSYADSSTAAGPYLPTDEGNLTLANLGRTYELLKALEPSTIYYALSEFVPDKKAIYKMPLNAYGKARELFCMHPDQFPEFELHARAAGYRLVDLRTYKPEQPPLFAEVA